MVALNGVALTRSEARLAVRLIGDLQNQLEAAIDGELVNGQAPTGNFERAVIRKCRRQWAQAERLVKAISEQLPEVEG